jgi:4-aminobutyrate aminotransferase
MNTNSDFDDRRNKAVARAIGYTSTFTAERAENAELWDVEGKRYIDFCGGIGCQNVGHRHPQVIAAIENQLGQLTHTCFQISPYKSYIELAERINTLAPGDFEKKSLFFSSGGEAIENAIKIARYYTRKPAIITFTNGYHGRSYMGMGLSARMSPFKQGFRPFPTEIYRIPFPDDYHGVSRGDAIRGIETLLKSDADADSIGAVIFEPVQGEGGYNIADGEFLHWIREFCNQNNIVLIADEIQTGCGRSGKMFACEHFDLVPDLTCIGKSIGGGLPLSGVVGRADIIDSVPPGGLGAVLEVIEEENLLNRGLELGARIGKRFAAMASSDEFLCVGDARGLGAMNAIEIVKDRASRQPARELTAAIISAALEQGLILIGAGSERNVIRVLVPLTASFELIDEGLDILESAIRSIQ